jgi:hypothetical protein
VRVPIDKSFAREVEKFSLQFTCRDCFHFRAGACAHEWPNELHLDPPEDGATEVVFCKEFELD